MIVLTRGHDHLAALTEEGGVHRQRVDVLVETLRALRLLLLHERVGLPRSGETADVEELDRPPKRGGEKQRPRRMHVELRLSFLHPIRCSPSYRAPGRTIRCRVCASR